MLESVMIIRLATGAMVEVVVPFGFSKAGFLSGCPVELGVVAASKEGTEDAEFHAGVGADGGYTHGAPERAEEDAVGVDLAGLRQRLHHKHDKSASEIWLQCGTVRLIFNGSIFLQISGQ